MIWLQSHVKFHSFKVDQPGEILVDTFKNDILNAVSIEFALAMYLFYRYKTFKRSHTSLVLQQQY